MHHERRLVALAALGHGRQVGRVGLDQQGLQRHEARDLGQVAGVLERDDAGQRHQEAEVERSARLRDRPRETVKDTAAVAPALVEQDAHGIVEGVGAVGGPDVQHQWLLRSVRDGDLAHEHLPLHVARRVVVVVVEPALADGDAAWVCR
ncbi:MAG: hypothetical protein A2138_18575 [Deltaproteobacteria bacterium RBG_16_71_12]|nr:MAG: hypothetical protein A2138_18575 [Deltaproteobacteria bacterium RBG_16_71_12]